MRDRVTVPHTIQIFSGGCALCRDVVDIVELGKCKDCKMEVLDIGRRENAELTRRYDISAVPSIVIDGKIKVVGKPDFPWFCGDRFYKMLEKRFPLKA
jgi:Thioredoxin domain